MNHRYFDREAMRKISSGFIFIGFLNKKNALTSYAVNKDPDQNCALAQYDQSLRCQLIELVDIIEYIDGQNER